MAAKPTHWADIQQNVFTRWCNEYLKKRGMHVMDVQKDLCDGLALINLLEIVTDKKFGRYNKHPVVPFQKVENCVLAIEFMEKEDIKIVNISGDDIAGGRLKLILGLLWTLIQKYQLSEEEKNLKDELLKWVQKMIPSYDIKGFKGDWNDGKALCALCDAVEPGIYPNHAELDGTNKLENCQSGLDCAFNELGVPKLIAADEMANPRVDERGMIMYIYYMRDAWKKLEAARLEAKEKEEELVRQKFTKASRCNAFGPGLNEGLVQEESCFTVNNPSGDGELQVKIDGPEGSEEMEVSKEGNEGGTEVVVKYTPPVQGEYKVSITLDGIDIPGSVFSVLVLEEINLGGEGKIRVFYSTTSGGKLHTRPLQELLEKKGVHLRPDFEPWIAVDLMPVEDRNLVFKKAGTKKLPIVYIDDVYVGDMEKIFELEKSGELDELLQTNKHKFEEDEIVQAMEQWRSARKQRLEKPEEDDAEICRNCGAARRPKTAKFCSCGRKWLSPEEKAAKAARKEERRKKREEERKRKEEEEQKRQEEEEEEERQAEEERKKAEEEEKKRQQEEEEQKKKEEERKKRKAERRARKEEEEKRRREEERDREEEERRRAIEAERDAARKKAEAEGLLDDSDDEEGDKKKKKKKKKSSKGEDKKKKKSSSRSKGKDGEKRKKK